MLRKQKITSKVASIMLMLMVAALSFNGLASSLTGATPVSVTVPTASLEVSGYAAPNAFVTIYDGSNPMATVAADSNGVFSKLITSIASGLHSISVTQQDISGIESAANNRVVSIPPQQLTQLEFAIPPTIVSNKNNVTVGESLTISGYATPSQTVELVLNNAVGVYATTAAGPDGKYEFVIDTSGFYIGSHIVKVRANSPIGFSDYSKDVSFMVTEKEPIQPPGQGAGSGDVGGGGNGGANYAFTVQQPLINNPANQAIVNGDKATIKGLAQPNSQVIITVNDVVVGSVFANSKGIWLFDYYPTEVQNVVTVVSCVNNVCSMPSTPVEFSFNKVLGAVDCKDSVDLSKYIFSIKAQENVTVKANYNITKARTILIDWGDGQTEKFTVPADAKTGKYIHVYGNVGQYNGRVTSAHEQDSCVTTQFFTVKVSDAATTGLNGNLLAIIIVGLMAATLLIFGYRQRRKRSNI